MKKKAMIALSLITGIIAIWIILRLIPFNDIIYTFTHTSWQIALGYLAISIGIMITLTWRWLVILRSQKIKIPFLNLFAYRIIGYGISFITPTAKLGGEPVRAALLGRHNVSFKKALSSVFIDKAIETTSSSAFFFVGVVTMLISFAIPKDTGMILLILASVFVTGATIFYQRLMRGKPVVMPTLKLFRIHKIKKLNLTDEKMLSFENLLVKFFKKDKGNFFIAINISLLSWILMFIEFKLALMMLGLDVSIGEIFLIICFIGAAVAVPVPMAIGTLEAGQIAAFSIIKLKSATAVALAFLVRARDLLWSVIGLALLSYYGLKISKAIKKSYSTDKKKILKDIK